MPQGPEGNIGEPGIAGLDGRKVKVLFKTTNHLVSTIHRRKKDAGCQFYQIALQSELVLKRE